MSESSALSLARHPHEKVEGDTVALSVVVPFYNEEENLPVLEARLWALHSKCHRNGTIAGTAR